MWRRARASKWTEARRLSAENPIGYRSVTSPTIPTETAEDTFMTDNRSARGKKIRDEAFGKDGLKTWDELNAICPTHARAIHEYCFGTIWDRPHLDLKFRELIIIAVAAASDCPNEVGLHARGALNRGATRDEIVETILQCSPYIGFPKTNHALKAAKDVFDRWESKTEDWKPA
jgi:4-carboxymuconolactone decarboxylase